MRYLPKAPPPPPVLAEYLRAQTDLGYNLDYASFSRAREYRQALIEEQHGLCGYTGVAIDARLVNRRQALAEQSPPATVKLQAHTEHLKPQSECRRELLARGQQPGQDLGEDMDHCNMIAALEVSGAATEQFGAAARGNTPLPVWPTHPDCEARFAYTMDGRVLWCDAQAQATAETLKLNHPTLKNWRKADLDGFLPDDLSLNRAEIVQLIHQLGQPEAGCLREFSFVLQSALRSLLLPA
jgi:hypothetical protein